MSENIIIENLRRENEELKRLAYFDLLTGLHNLNYLSINADDYIRSNTPISLMLIDLDNMKQLNSTIGFAATDARIKSLFVDIKHSIKDRDCCGRVYGDELILILSNTISSHSASIAERILQIAQNHKLSLSIGIAISFEYRSYQSLFNQANKALLNAKNNGKNRYEFY